MAFNRSQARRPRKGLQVYVTLEQTVVEANLRSVTEHLRLLERKINRSRSNRININHRPYPSLKIGLHRNSSGLDVAEYLITLR